MAVSHYDYLKHSVTFRVDLPNWVYDIPQDELESEFDCIGFVVDYEAANDDCGYIEFCYGNFNLDNVKQIMYASRKDVKRVLDKLHYRLKGGWYDDEVLT